MIVGECATHPQEVIDKDIPNLKYLNARGIGWQERSEIVSEGGKRKGKGYGSSANSGSISMISTSSERYTSGLSSGESLLLIGAAVPKISGHQFLCLYTFHFGKHFAAVTKYESINE